jgi:hypothetical protein
MRTQSWVVRVSRGIAPNPHPFQARAARQLEASAAALGTYRARILYGHRVEDLPWRKLGARLGPDKGARNAPS